MSDYDFHRIFEPMEFQNFARDIIQKKEDIVLESFAEGRDRGIDGRYVRDDGYTIIFQAKRMAGTLSKLLKVAKEEKEKLDKLPRVDRYILVVSVDLSEEGKEKILKTLSPYIIHKDDVIGSNDLNNYLDNESAKYRTVEENYFKLWIQNTKTLRKVLFETVNGYLVEQSKIKLEDTIQKAKIFVETEIYEEAIRRVQCNRALIISGMPGVGKTTLAEQMALFFCARFQFERYLYAVTVEDLYTIQGIEGRKVIVFDDFWGSNGFDGFGNGKKTKSLLTFIEYIQKQRDTILIMTTREYILEQGLRENEDFRRFVKQNKIDFQIEEYSKEDRLRIYFGHLRNSSLTWEQIHSLIEIGDEVIQSKNYNPRVIAAYTKTITAEIEPDVCVEEFLKYLECPDDFWRKIYNELSNEAKRVYLIMAIMPNPVELQVLKECYYAVIPQNCEILEQKEFEKVIFELERTVIRTDSYNQNFATRIAVTYQNPSARDFILSFIEKNIEQYKNLLYESCLYFEQCIEFLKILSDINYKGNLYEQVMEKSIQLIDTECIDFYRKYRRSLNYNKELDKFSQTYYRTSEGSGGDIGRYMQMVLLYKEETCIHLKNQFLKILLIIMRVLERCPETVPLEDLNLFQDVAVIVIKEGLYENVDYLIELYMDSLMRCRVRLIADVFSKKWNKQWEEYKHLHKEKIRDYLEKYYRSELCLAATEGDFYKFSEELDNREEDLSEYNLTLTEKDKEYLHKYDKWLDDIPVLEDAEEGKVEKVKHQIISIEQIYNDFREGYVEEILPEKIEDPEEWIQIGELLSETKSILLETLRQGNELWDCFMWDEASLDFLAMFVEKKGYLADDILAGIHDIVFYIEENCNLNKDELFKIFLTLNMDNHRNGVWSREELGILYPEFWQWNEKQINELVEAKIFTSYHQWYRLSNLIIIFCVYIEKLQSLSDKERKICYQGIFEIEKSESDGGSEELDRLISIGRLWREEYKIERMVLPALKKLSPQMFEQHVLAPLADTVYQQVYNDSVEQIIRNLIEMLRVEIELNEDGTVEGGGVYADEYFVIREAVDDAYLLDIIPESFTQNQMSLLSEYGLIQGEVSRIELKDLLEKNLLEKLELYNPILQIWDDICCSRQKGISDGKSE